MTQPFRPAVRFLDEDTIVAVVNEARTILEEIGVFVEHEKAKELLDGAGARVGDDGRVHIPADLVARALETAPSELYLYDSLGEEPVRVGGDAVNFDPGSAAIKVYDWKEGRVRPSTTSDCILFSRLTDLLPSMAFQSTCVVPSDVPLGEADRRRLGLALMNGRKAVITGTFSERSFEIMRQMLVCVRGSEEELRAKPLAVFDCCPSPPLKWSELTCAALVDSAVAGIPAELVSMPMTGATSPVTLLGAVTQHTAENMSGVVIHQLAAPGAPIIYGGSPSAFDMRHGTTPMGAVETMMIDAAYAEVGKHLGLPTHAYMALSDAKTPDYQAGLESGYGAILAALAGINVISGPGMLDFESCQSLEKLLCDSEACSMALRAVKGIERRDEVIASDKVKAGLDAGQFLNLDHTRRWYRDEVHFPGPVIDRQVGDAWQAAGAKTAAERAADEVERLLAKWEPPPHDESVMNELDRLMKVQG